MMPRLRKGRHKMPAKTMAAPTQLDRITMHHTVNLRAQDQCTPMAGFTDQAHRPPGDVPRCFTPVHGQPCHRIAHVPAPPCGLRRQSSAPRTLRAMTHARQHPFTGQRTELPMQQAWRSDAAPHPVYAQHDPEAHCTQQRRIQRTRVLLHSSMHTQPCASIPSHTDTHTTRKAMQVRTATYTAPMRPTLPHARAHDKHPATSRFQHGAALRAEDCAHSYGSAPITPAHCVPSMGCLRAHCASTAALDATAGTLTATQPHTHTHADAEHAVPLSTGNVHPMTSNTLAQRRSHSCGAMLGSYTARVSDTVARKEVPSTHCAPTLHAARQPCD